TLSNALEKGQLSHCYLFVGPIGALQQEAAILLAQSFICSEKKDGWACEQCIECMQMQNREYADLIYLDGSRETIKIDQINKLQTQFAQTALTQAGRKVFIINDCENMTGKASNSLLKFIEEPSDNTLGIFITSQLTRVLPTIASRCQQITFRPLSHEAFRQHALEKGLDDLNAHLISQLAHSEDETDLLSEDETYQAAVRYFVEFMHYYFQNFPSALLYLQDNGFRLNAKAKDNKKSREVFDWFLQIATIFVNDYHSQAVEEDESWRQLLETAHQNHFDSRNFLNTVCETRDALIRSANLSLLIDQMLYKLSGGTND
ncbi:MAG: DNA polymerase III subunit delta, partial [Clostridia bacterium]|nr:DNA polymerase III subunit delta [Clostridia bacterium]